MILWNEKQSHSLFLTKIYAEERQTKREKRKKLQLKNINNENKAHISQKTGEDEFFFFFSVTVFVFP